MREPFIAGNWKMNTTLSEAKDLALGVRMELRELNGVTRVVCPPFISIPAVADIMAGSGILVGAQNLNPNPPGAYTGEIAAAMLTGLCSHVIVGHSERRALCHETDADVAAKAAAALGAGMRPIVCVGESLEVRESGDAVSHVSNQLRASLASVTEIVSVVVAYEPIWAIGTGRAASPEIAQEMIGAIRSTLAGMYGDDEASTVPLLYGGSVNSVNIADFMAQPDVDGALVGGASLKADEFARIVRAAAPSGR